MRPRDPRRWREEGSQSPGPLPASPSSTSGRDVVDTVLAHLKGAPRTRRQVAHHLVRLGLADSVKDLQRYQRYRRAPWRGWAGPARGPERLHGPSPNRKGAQTVLWAEDQELELRRLFEEFQDSAGGCGAARGPLGGQRAVRFSCCCCLFPREAPCLLSVHLLYLRCCVCLFLKIFFSFFNYISYKCTIHCSMIHYSH